MGPWLAASLTATALPRSPVCTYLSHDCCTVMHGVLACSIPLLANAFASAAHLVIIKQLHAIISTQSFLSTCMSSLNLLPAPLLHPPIPGTHLALILLSDSLPVKCLICLPKKDSSLSQKDQHRRFLFPSLTRQCTTQRQTMCESYPQNSTRLEKNTQRGCRSAVSSTDTDRQKRITLSYNTPACCDQSGCMQSLMQ